MESNTKQITSVWAKVLIYVALSLGAIIMLFPFIFMILTSLKTYSESIAVPPKLFPSVPQFDNYKVAMVYYPEFLRALKESFNTTDEFKNKFNYIKKVDVLLLDDIGAETVTEWSRDEILGTILQYRMEENLPTLFTSNLTIEELEKHLSTTSKDVDIVKARRIIERIKQLTINITMISENKRK